jgi:hypothetical protein
MTKKPVLVCLIYEVVLLPTTLVAVLSALPPTQRSGLEMFLYQSAVTLHDVTALLN